MKVVLAPRFSELNWKRVRRIFSLFSPYLNENRRWLALAMVGGLGATAMRLAKPWPLKLIFDGVLMPQEAPQEGGPLAALLSLPPSTLIAGACLGLLAISLLWGLFASRQVYLTARAGQEVVYSLRRKVYSHLLRLSLSFHHRRRRGDLVMRLTGDINLLRDLLVDSMLLGLGESFMLVTMITVMAIMNWKLTLVALVVLPLLALTTFSFSIQIREAARRQRRNEGRVAGLVSEMLASVQLIQAFGRERHQAGNFQKSNRKSLKAGLRTTRLEAAMSRSVELLLAAGTAGVLWFGVHQVQAGAMTPGDLLVFIAYLGSSYRPLRKLARVSSRMSKAVVCAERVTEVLRSAPEVEDRPGAKQLKRLAGAVEFQRVKFSYAGGRKALRRVSFAARPGELVGVVGPSGSGKSTLLALLLRLYDPRSGKVLIDGRDVRRYTVQSLRDNLAVVLQEPLLFGATVRENIAFGRPEATDAEIEECARLAEADEFVRQLPAGYDTAMAEAGASLSLGQRQRLSIARAFLRDAPILLLDEPTAGLDASTEKGVEKALRRLMRGRTTLLVAHQLAAVRRAHRILVVRKGRIAESGRHDELLRLGGWYAHNYRLQQRRLAAVRKPATVASEPAAEDVPVLRPIRLGGTGR